MCIMTHSLSKELLNKPNMNVVVSVGEREYTIGKIKTRSTFANKDDSNNYITLVAEKECCGNLMR